MKANQKFVNGEDDAVSPVIAVILMVAITVVLAATVYVWVSGFGGSGSAAKTISLTSNSALTGGAKSYSVAQATSGMKWSDISFTVNGVTKTLDGTDGCAGTPPAPSANTKFLPCHNGAEPASTAVIFGGDTIYFAGLSSGDTINVLDSQANSIMTHTTVS